MVQFFLHMIINLIYTILTLYIMSYPAKYNSTYLQRATCHCLS